MHIFDQGPCPIGIILIGTRCRQGGRCSGSRSGFAPISGRPTSGLWVAVGSRSLRAHGYQINNRSWFHADRVAGRHRRHGCVDRPVVAGRPGCARPSAGAVLQQPQTDRASTPQLRPDPRAAPPGYVSNWDPVPGGDGARLGLGQHDPASDSSRVRSTTRSIRHDAPGPHAGPDFATVPPIAPSISSHRQHPEPPGPPVEAGLVKVTGGGMLELCLPNSATWPARSYWGPRGGRARVAGDGAIFRSTSVGLSNITDGLRPSRRWRWEPSIQLSRAGQATSVSRRPPCGVPRLRRPRRQPPYPNARSGPSRQGRRVGDRPSGTWQAAAPASLPSDVNQFTSRHGVAAHSSSADPRARPLLDQFDELHDVHKALQHPPLSAESKSRASLGPTPSDPNSDAHRPCS